MVVTIDNETLSIATSFSIKELIFVKLSNHINFLIFLFFYLIDFMRWGRGIFIQFIITCGSFGYLASPQKTPVNQWDVIELPPATCPASSHSRCKQQHVRMSGD